MISISPIALVRNGRKTMEDDDWGEIVSIIELLPPFQQEAFQGIESFSHVEILFLFDRVDNSKVETGMRHPRENLAWPLVGIFSQRGKDRPNRIGATICTLLGHNGNTITVKGLDALDGSPVLDIKPVLKEFLPREKVSQPDWADDLMANYWGKSETDISTQ